jgi:hypothetical protein
MISVFIVCGNYKMRCNPIAEHTLMISKMSNELVSMLNETHHHHHECTPPAATVITTSPSVVPDRPNVALLINVIWTISLTFSLASTFFGVMVRRWAIRYLFNNLHRIDTRIPRCIQAQISKDLVTSRPLSLVALIRFFLPLSVALFFLGLVIFMVHIGIFSALVFISSLVLLLGCCMCFLFSHVTSLLTSLVRIYEV